MVFFRGVLQLLYKEREEESKEQIFSLSNFQINMKERKNTNNILAND